MSFYPPNAVVQKTQITTGTEGGGVVGTRTTMGEEAKDQVVNGQMSHFPPSQYQHNQLRQQQQQNQQMEYQQQQILQHKLNQQQTMPQMPGNMNKYLPPTTIPSSHNKQQQPSTQIPSTSTNAPTIIATTATTTTPVLPPVNNLPPHMWPPKLNHATLTNGGENGSNATSRTNSPGVQQLSGSMQNLNLQQRHVNGVLPPQQQQQQQVYTGSSRLPPPPLTTTTTAVPSSNNQPQGVIQPTNNFIQQQKQQLGGNMNYAPQPATTPTGVRATMPPPTSGMQNHYNNNNNNNNIGNNNFGQNGAPKITETTTSPYAPISAPTTINSTQRRPMYPMQAPSAAQQQQLYQQSAPNMPPAPPQQFQQQPYADVYHQSFPNQQTLQQQQQQRIPGTFNGQATTGALQYQSQQQMPSKTAATTSPYMQQQPQQHQQQSGGLLQQGFNRLWGQDTIDLMQIRHIMATTTMEPPKIVLHNQFHESINCNPNIMRCTIAKIPESNALLQKSRLPLGILIHPFRDINSLPVIQCPSIVRCRLCRTYINPFVYFVDSKMWKCNLCYRVNELPEDFQYDPATKTYGDVTRRPEVRSSTIEFIAPSEYMLRPPQPAIYLFIFDVSIIAQQSGYLESLCTVLSQHLDDMPGDARTRVGFIAYNSHVHFYSMAEGYNQPHEMTLVDIDDPFLPRPDNLLVNLKECKELIKDLLNQLPRRFADTHDHGSAMGAALQVAYKLMQASGGRVTVFQTCLPNKGPGALEPREDPNNRSAKDVAHLNPATDFYKRFALECSGNQIAVDLFLLNQQYSDMATISGISKHSGGCVHHFPLYQKTKKQHEEAFKNCFKRYLVRKIGFEAVMRIRCTRGLQVHTFHGNFFVRSTDLLSLPNVNPDAGYGMQISYEESLTDVKTICFQAALLYTNSEGERRIRVHTLCLPVTASLPEVMHAADTEAIIGLLAKMAVDRSIGSNISDARDAFINATVDIFNAFKIAQNLPSGQTGQLIAPRSLSLLPLYILALLKHSAFRVGTSTRLDDRVYAMDCMKTLPLDQLMKFIYPEFYNIDVLFYKTQNYNNVLSTTDEEDDEEDDLPEIRRLQLSAEHLDSRSIFLMDCGTLIMIYVGLNVPINILENVLGVRSTAELPDYVYGLPHVNSAENCIVRRFIDSLNDDKPYPPIVQIIRDTSTAKPQFIEKLVDDRSESSLSVYEFLQHIRSQVK